MPTRTVCLVAILLLSGTGAVAGEPDRSDPAYWLEKATGYAERITVPDGRAAALVSIGNGYMRFMAHEEARPLLAAAAEYGRTCTGCYAKAQRLADVALLQHDAGDPLGAEQTFRLAREACDELGEGADRVRALGYLAVKRHAAGEAMLARPLFVEALESAKRLEGEEHKEVLGELAVNLDSAGEWDMMRAAVARIQRPVPLLVIDLWLARLEPRAHRGEVDGLEKELARFQGHPRARLEALGMLAVAYAKAEEPAGVLRDTALSDAAELARSFRDPRKRVTSLAKVARAAHEANDPVAAASRLREASSVAYAVEDRVQRARALLAIARAASAAGDRDMMRARLEAAMHVADAAFQDRALIHPEIAKVASTLGVNDLADAALAHAPSVEDRIAVAEITLRRGDVERARGLVDAAVKVLETWDDERRRENEGTFRRLAVLQAGLGEFEKAEATVDAIGKDSPFNAATACTYIARDLLTRK